MKVIRLTIFIFSICFCNMPVSEMFETHAVCAHSFIINVLHLNCTYEVTTSLTMALRKTLLKMLAKRKVCGSLTYAQFQYLFHLQLRRPTLFGIRRIKLCCALRLLSVRLTACYYCWRCSGF